MFSVRYTFLENHVARMQGEHDALEGAMVDSKTLKQGRCNQGQVTLDTRVR